MQMSINLSMVNQIAKVNQEKNAIPFYSPPLKTFQYLATATFDGVYIKRITIQCNLYL